MSLAARVRPLWFLVIAVLACDGGPSGPSSPSLTVTILGLPTGTAAAVTVSGPDGFSQPATETQTFTQLTPGTYTVTATSVTVSAADYTPNPASQTVVVPSSSGQANATILYSQVTGNIAVTITGLGSGSTAAVTVTGPGYSQAVTATTTLLGLDPGSYTIAARDTVATGGTAHTASPTSQTVTVAAQTTANANVSYTPPPANGTVNLRIAGMYLTQSAQTYAGTVPLVVSRDGYLRVFVVADRSNAAAPAVKVRYFNGLIPVDSVTIVSPSLAAPTAVDESSLNYSWNAPVAGSLIQPNLRIQAEVDPTGTVVETDETDNAYPAAAPLAMDVRTVPTLRITFVPIRSPNGQQGSVTEANKDAFLDMIRRMHPIEAVDAVVGEPFISTRALQANGTGWVDLLFDFNAAIAADGRYYYGVVKVPYTSGVAGVAYVSQGSANAHAALGWDRLINGSGSIVAAHELAHNWGRNHAPCGAPAGPDPAYPQSDGSIGSYGLDVPTATLKPSSLGDIMGYCDPKWIGQYTYRGVMDYRIALPLVMGANAAMQPSLLVWGRIRNGELVLEPAFQVNTRPRLPERPGPYSVEAQAGDGSTLFNFSFTPSAVADAPDDQQHFAFAIPLSAAKAARLSSLRLRGRGRETVTSARVGMSDSVTIRRVDGDRVALRWNVGAHPTVMVRDPETGQILSFVRGGDVELSTAKDQLDLVLSDGVKSRLKRVRVVR